MGFIRKFVHDTFAPRLLSWSGGYEAASGGRRMASWNPSDSGVNALVEGDLSQLRRRSRDIVRKNPWAGSGIDSYIANLVGLGIKPRSKHPDQKTQERINHLWLRWIDEADAAERTSFYGLQSLAARSMIESGEALVRIRTRRPADGLVVPLQLQLLEADHLPLDKTQMLKEGWRIRAGIEFNSIDRRVAYHLHREHPTDASLLSGAGGTVRVPADQVLHMYRLIRPGQIRGVPWLAQVLVKLYELDQYDDAEVVRKKIAAMFSGFITKGSPEDSVLPTTTTAGSSTAPDKVDFSGLEPGTMQELLPGEDVKFSEPADVGGMYGEFMRVQLRAVAVGMGITYEQLTGDLTGVNYSSIRAGLLEFRRRCEQLQWNVLIFQFCRPVWRKWIETAVLSGALPIGDYRQHPEHYRAVDWRTPRWAWVDPLKDAKAEIAQIRAGLKSRSASIAEMGYDVEEVDAEVSQDNERADELGLVYDSDPRKVAAAGQGQEQEQEQGEEPQAVPGDGEKG